MSDVERLIRDREEQLHNGIAYRTAGVERVVMNQHQVMLSDGEAVDYDVLVVASGAELAMDETEGLGGDGWGEKVFTFYTPEGAAELAEAMQWLREGRLVVNVVDMPIKCPVAPLEFCFLADWFLREQGVREQVELSYVTTLDGALPMPVVAKALGGMLAARGIALVTEFNTAQVDGVGGRLISYDEREVAFDLAVVIPAQCGAGCIRRSEGLGDELGFIDVDPYTLQSRVDPAVFAVGDAAALPTVKVGSVAMWSGEVVVENVVHYLAGEELVAGYDGHTNCFIETGNGKAMMLDFNYETEPVGGHFPSQVGLGLLKESQVWAIPGPVRANTCVDRRQRAWMSSDTRGSLLPRQHNPLAHVSGKVPDRDGAPGVPVLCWYNVGRNGVRFGCIQDQLGHLVAELTSL
jgi:sulfide:quinone oxidoreductase